MTQVVAYKSRLCSRESCSRGKKFSVLDYFACTVGQKLEVLPATLVRHDMEEISVGLSRRDSRRTTDARVQKGDMAEDERMEKNCKDGGEGGSLSESLSVTSTLSPPLAVSPPREYQAPKTRSAAKISPQKQASTSRRRKVQDKNCMQENGTNAGSYEITRMAISETFFMPVSKKRKLLVEENKVEALQAVPAEVAPVKAVPTLRAKAAVDAKEDAIRSAGKAIHPLFLRAKTSGTKVMATCSEVGFLEPCPPMHVTQCLEEESTEPDLRETCVYRNPLIERCKEEELVHCLIQQGHSLRKDLLMPRSSLLTSKNRESLLPDSSLQRIPSSALQQGIEDLLEYLKQATESRRKLFGAYLQPVSDSTIDESITVEKLRERLTWYKARHDSLLPLENKEARSSHKNMLWTDVYEPKSCKEVCGNATGVELLNSWMRSWRERMMGQVNGLDVSRKTIAVVPHSDSDCDRGWFEDDSDVDTDDDNESDLHSILLITGPTGCGKTAAIYACAAEQGLTIIEVSASSCRSGASLMQKFGRGGLESQAMGKWSTFEDQEEFDTGLTQPHTKVKVLQKVNGQKDGKLRASRNSGVILDKCAVGSRKPLDSCASTEVNSSVSVEDPQTGSPQKKKMTVILFEDVDLQFEEDKGFWTSLVQLAKKTKRPIILTTNSRQPGLPQILEKARIDYSYPSSEELTLHAFMICVVEGVACSPWMVSRLVESCRCDMRKLLMSLQFWKQDACSSPVSATEDSTPCDLKPSDKLEDIVTRSGSGDCSSETGRRLSLRRPLPDSNPLLSPTGERDNKCSTGERVDLFSQWDLDARYLYDLDIHHMVLPHVFSSDDPCAFSLDIARRINAAVAELENHVSLIAARDAELQGWAQQAQLDAAEAERKAQRKSKDVQKRVAKSAKPRVIQDEDAAVLWKLFDNSDTKGNSPANISPVKGIREARALARSPLKQRRLLLINSDNEEESQAGDHLRCFPSIVNHSSGVQLTRVMDIIEATPADVVINNSMEDTDSMPVATMCESVPTVKRLRLRQLKLIDVQSSSVPSSSMEVGILDVNAAAVTQSKSPEHSTYSLHIQSPSRVSEAELVEKGVSDRLHPIERSLPRVEDQPMDQSPEHMTRSPGARQGETKPTGERVVLDLDLNLKSWSEYDEDAEFVDDNNVSKHIPGDKKLGSSINVKSPCGPAVSSMTGPSGGDNTSPRLENDVEKVGVSGSFVEDSTSRSSISQVKRSDNAEGCDTDVGVFIETKSEAVDPVQEAWKKLRAGLDSLLHKIVPSRRKKQKTDALAIVLDAVSASDTISSFSSESWKTARTTLSGAWNGAFEGNIGHCSYWEGCQEIASQLVRTSLQTSPMSLQICGEDKLLVALGILLAAKDVPAVGKCIINFDDVTSIRNLASQLRNTGESCIKDVSVRQSGRRQRLDEIISTRFHPKGRITGSSLVDYVAYLGMINQREEERRNQVQTVSDNRRSRRFQHHLGSKISNADIAEFCALCRFVKA
ncbi:hypothetical protein R1flu_007645 [Riccia fluitans]|uniref:AAA+ ATPase domain-containing protein n=1 Tax=Riccia fluitans TaxID=41844 RepID=A0ABD1YZG9_9MARC